MSSATTHSASAMEMASINQTASGGKYVPPHTVAPSETYHCGAGVVLWVFADKIGGKISPECDLVASKRGAVSRSRWILAAKLETPRAPANMMVALISGEIIDIACPWPDKKIHAYFRQLK